MTIGNQLTIKTNLILNALVIRNWTPELFAFSFRLFLALSDFGLKMLADKKFFKIFWLFLSFFGMRPHKQNWIQQARGLFLFLLFVISNAVLVTAAVAALDSVKLILAVFQVYPAMLNIWYDLAVFYRNSREVEEFFNNLCRIVNESDDEKLFAQFYKKSIRISSGLGVLAFLSVIGFSASFLLTGPLMPIWTPDDNDPLFFAIWVIESFYMAFHMFHIWLVESFLFIVLNILSAYSLHLRKFIRTSPATNQGLVECVEKYLEFKMWD